MPEMPFELIRKILVIEIHHKLPRPGGERGIARYEVGLGDLKVDLRPAQRFVLGLHDEIGVDLATGAQAFRKRHP